MWNRVVSLTLCGYVYLLIMHLSLIYKSYTFAHRFAFSIPEMFRREYMVLSRGKGQAVDCTESLGV